METELADRLDTHLLPTEGPLMASVKINEHMSLCSIPTNLLFDLAPDPREAEDKKKIAASKTLEKVAELRDDVQRMFEGSKRKNVPSYAKYIVGLQHGAEGMTPPIILYSPDELPSDHNSSGLGYLQAPYGTKLVAIDGETQLAARYEAANIDPATAKEKVAVYVIHGRPKNWARQSFHDLNLLSVKPNTALGIGMDARDPLTQVARTVEIKVPFLRGRVNKARRQLRSGDTDVVTITALRGACVTFAEGISGVKYGAKSVSVPESKLPRIEEVAVEWFGALTEEFGAAMADREYKLASAPSVLAALGAIGHDLINIDNATERGQKIQQLIGGLRDVDWRRAKHWEGIAGKFTPKGAFSVGGSKETAYAVFDALADRSSPSYQLIRSAPAAAAE
jgi:DGQHR domain-containing protein